MNEKVEKNLNTTKSYTYLSNTKKKISNSDNSKDNNDKKDIKVNNTIKHKNKSNINEKKTIKKMLLKDLL